MINIPIKYGEHIKAPMFAEDEDTKVSIDLTVYEFKGQVCKGEHRVDIEFTVEDNTVFLCLPYTVTKTMELGNYVGDIFQIEEGNKPHHLTDITITVMETKTPL